MSTDAGYLRLLDAVGDEMTHLNETIGLQGGVISEMREALELGGTTLTAKNQRLDAAQRTIERLEKENQELQVACAEDRARSSSSHANALRAVDRLEKENKNLRAHVDERASVWLDLDNALRAVDRLEKENKNLQEQIKTLTAARCELDKQHAIVKEENQDIREQIRSCNTLWREIDKDHTLALRTIASLDKRLKDKEKAKPEPLPLVVYVARSEVDNLGHSVSVHTTRGGAIAALMNVWPEAHDRLVSGLAWRNARSDTLVCVERAALRAES